MDSGSPDNQTNSVRETSLSANSGGEAARVNEDGKVVLELLSSEYRLLQDKIDKIGAFRFTVKGWSVTLVMASTFAVGANENVDPSILLFLIVFVVAFGVLEWKQVRLSVQFGQRLFELEREFPRLRRTLEPDQSKRVRIFASPRIANLLHEDSKKPGQGVVDRLGRWISSVSDAWFYAVQLLVVLGALFVLSGPERGRAEQERPVTIIENNAFGDSSRHGTSE